jgi:hypothetical protein
MLARKPIQDISVIDVTGDIDFREMIRIKDAIGSLIERDQTKSGSESEVGGPHQLFEHRRAAGAFESAAQFERRFEACGHEPVPARYF